MGEDVVECVEDVLVVFFGREMVLGFELGDGEVERVEGCSGGCCV